jgi:hypothetical protein
MIAKEENELLCRTGPGTPMGELFRRFWLPVALSRELPKPDCAPVRLRILSEDLIGFRETSGQVSRNKSENPNGSRKPQTHASCKEGICRSPEQIQWKTHSSTTAVKNWNIQCQRLDTRSVYKVTAAVTSRRR